MLRAPFASEPAPTIALRSRAMPSWKERVYPKIGATPPNGSDAVAHQAIVTTGQQRIVIELAQHLELLDQVGTDAFGHLRRVTVGAAQRLGDLPSRIIASLAARSASITGLPSASSA